MITAKEAVSATEEAVLVAMQNAIQEAARRGHRTAGIDVHDTLSVRLRQALLDAGYDVEVTSVTPNQDFVEATW